MKKRSLVLNEEQVTCLASPLRKELMSAFINHGPTTVAEIGRKLGRRAKSLYYHVEQLVDAGLVKAVGQQPGVKKPETVYGAVSSRLELASNPSESYRESSRKSIQALIRLTARQFDKAEVAGRRPRVTKVSFQLTREDQSELAAKLKQVFQWAEERSSRGPGRLNIVLLEIPQE
jgi:predicted ArsR family transcriptional regulator